MKQRRRTVREWTAMQGHADTGTSMHPAPTSRGYVEPQPQTATSAFTAGRARCASSEAGVMAHLSG